MKDEISAPTPSLPPCLLSPLLHEEGKVYSKCHAQMDKLHMKNSTVTTCNVLLFQMHFVSSLLYIIYISLFILFIQPAVKRHFKTQLTAFCLQMLRDIFTSTS